MIKMSMIKLKVNFKTAVMNRMIIFLIKILIKVRLKLHKNHTGKIL